MRGEGKTHMMLLEALAAADILPTVYVVVQNQNQAIYCREILKRVTGTRHPKGIQMITPDNKCLSVVQGKPIMQGSDAPVFVDHYVWECGSMKHEF